MKSGRFNPRIYLHLKMPNERNRATNILIKVYVYYRDVRKAEYLSWKGTDNGFKINNKF